MNFDVTYAPRSYKSYIFYEIFSTYKLYWTIHFLLIFSPIATTFNSFAPDFPAKYMKSLLCEVQPMEILVSNINIIIPLVPKILAISAVLTILSMDG